MFCRPLQNHGKGTTRQIASNDFKCAYIYLCLELGVDGMKMRRRVLAPKHLNDEAEEDTDRWHGHIIIPPMPCRQRRLPKRPTDARSGGPPDASGILNPVPANGPCDHGPGRFPQEGEYLVRQQRR